MHSVKIETLREEIFALRPQFAKLVQMNGSKTLLEYYSQEFQNLLVPSNTILASIESEVIKILGEKIGKSASDAVRSQKWINTADHHGLLHHPYFYTASLARSHHVVCRETTATVTLPFGGVSLGNDSFPRGFSFHNSYGTLERFFFKSLKQRRLPVYALPPMTKEEFVKEVARSASFSLSKKAHGRLASFLNCIKNDIRVWEQKTYSSQLTVLNSILWNELFGTSRGDFVYLEIDCVVKDLLLTKHLVQETNVYRLLFKSEWRNSFIEFFAGIPGSHTDNSGTHFFWYIDYKNETRRRLILSNDSLCTEEGDLHIALTPESIASGLENKTLMPSTALLLIVVHAAESLACAGGPSQLLYLEMLMEKWQLLLCIQGGSEEVVIPYTGIWCGDNALFQMENVYTSVPKLATLIDCLLYEESFQKKADSALQQHTVMETVEAMVPTLHYMYTKVHQPIEYISTISTITIS